MSINNNSYKTEWDLFISSRVCLQDDGEANMTVVAEVGVGHKSLSASYFVIVGYLLNMMVFPNIYNLIIKRLFLFQTQPNFSEYEIFPNKTSTYTLGYIWKLIIFRAVLIDGAEKNSGLLFGPHVFLECMKKLTLHYLIWLMCIISNKPCRKKIYLRLICSNSLLEFYVFGTWTKFDHYDVLVRTVGHQKAIH